MQLDKEPFVREGPGIESDIDEPEAGGGVRIELDETDINEAGRGLKIEFDISDINEAGGGLGIEPMVRFIMP